MEPLTIPTISFRALAPELWVCVGVVAVLMVEAIMRQRGRTEELPRVGWDHFATPPR